MDVGKSLMARKWYQNVPVENAIFEDVKRKDSQFWNEGKWHNFIKPLLPESRGVFVEIGCNAGLFLKMAVDEGFRGAIGIESNRQIMDQAKRFRALNGITYNLLQMRIGVDSVLDHLPLSDVVLLANVHYYLPVTVFAKLVDRLKTRTLFCIVVSAKAKRRSGNALYDLNSVRGYFRDWREMKVVEGLEVKDDPAPRVRMYGVSFKGSLDVYDVETTYNMWKKGTVWANRHKDTDFSVAIEEYFKKVLDDEDFIFEETLLYQYWVKNSPGASPEWIRKKLAGKRTLAEDVRTNGMKDPLYYDAKGKLLDGIHRLAIARELGYKHILVRRL